MPEKEYYSITEIRAIEDNAFAMGHTVKELMENAGKAVAEEVNKRAKKEKNVVVFAGYGNNGGDGLVAARYLIQEGYDCRVVLTGKKEKFNSVAASSNYEELKKILSEEKWNKIKEAEDLEKIKDWLPKNAIFIDALLGIGIKGIPREPFASVINYFNETKCRIIALDVPSGYDPDGENPLYVKNPEAIICLGKNKLRKSDFPNSDIIVKDIGIPNEAEKIIGIGDLKWFLPQRKKDSHKRENGVVTIIGGSLDYIGAPALSGIGALRTGADLVYLVVPAFMRQIIACYYPDFITYYTESNFIGALEVKSALKDNRYRNSVWVIGPGRDVSSRTKRALKVLLSNKDGKLPIIIDAGALGVVDDEILKMLSQQDVILTPHRGEFKKLFKIDLPSNTEEALPIVSELAKKYQITLLVKGHHDLITDGKRGKINITGHPGMTVGGTGDVLTGIIAALRGIIKDSFIAACLGAYISGAAGEKAAEKYGNGLIASDIPEYINSVISQARNFRPTEI
ncbi:MAG: NAD(P)H-hydrate dehydratase [Candidatus Heimdallarchaeaceae archaeon]